MSCVFVVHGVCAVCVCVILSIFAPLVLFN